MWSDLYKSIVDRLKQQLSAQFANVYVGRLQPPSAFPCVYVLPQEVRETPTSPKTSMYEMIFRIRVITREVVSESAIKESTDLIGAVENMLISDRGFGGLVDNLEVDRIVYYVESPLSRDRQETDLIVRFVKVM